MSENTNRNPLLESIEKVGATFEEFKKINEQQILESERKNEARAQELAHSLEKVSADLSEHVKERAKWEKRWLAQQERLEIVEAMNDRPRGTIQEKLQNEHKELFIRWLRSKGTDRTAEDAYLALREKAREIKDVTIGTDADGGFALPEEISRTIDKLILKLSGIAANVNNVQVGTSDYKELVSVNSLTYAWSTETGSRASKTTPMLRNRAPTWGELYTYLTTSNWSNEDLFFDVGNWLVENASEGFAVGLSTSIYNGNGSGQPTGIFAGAPVTTDDYASPERAHGVIEYIPLTNPSSPYTSTGVNADSVIDLVYALRAGYRGNAKFAMNSVTQGHMRKLKDTNGQYLWQPSLQAGQPDRLLGYEVFTWEDLGNPQTANALAVAFGDFKKVFTLATRTGMQIIRESVTAPGFTKFYIARRFGGIVTNNNAVKVLKVAVS